MSDIDPSRDGRRARGRLLPRAGLFSGGTSTSARGRWPLCSGAYSPARSEPAGVWWRTPSAAAMDSLRLLQAARYSVLADDDHANEAPRVPSRKTTAPRRTPVAVPQS